MIKVLFEQGKRNEVIKEYNELLEFLTKRNVTGSYAEKSFNNMLDHLTKLSTSQNKNVAKVDPETLQFIEKICDATQAAFVKISNERMWLKTMLKMATFYSGQQNIEKSLDILEKVQNVCLGAPIDNPNVTPPNVDTSFGSNGDDMDESNTKSSYLVEVYAQLIILYSETGDYKKVKEIYKRADSLQTTIPHPRILGIIREAGGKMYLREKQYELSRQAFFDSFRNYDESGSLQRIAVLKYYVLACMLSQSNIDPFESPETRPYRNDPQINAMVRLVDAFQRNDTEEFQKLLQDKTLSNEIFADPFIREFIGDIEQSSQSSGILKLVQPYTRVRISKIAKVLDISEEEVRRLLNFLILENKLPYARIDMEGSYVDLKAATMSLDLKSTEPLGSYLLANSDPVSALKERQNHMGLSGGLAPVLGINQVPHDTLDLYDRPAPLDLSSNSFGSSFFGTSLASSSTASSSSKKKGSISASSSLNKKGSTAADMKQLFDIPKRYTLAIEENSKLVSIQNASVGAQTGAAVSGGAGEESAVGGLQDAGAAGNGSNNAGASGNGNNPANSSTGAASGIGSASGTTTSSQVDYGSGMEAQFRAEAINFRSPYAGAVQTMQRTSALLSWAKSVEKLQKVTQNGNAIVLSQAVEGTKGVTGSSSAKYDSSLLSAGANSIASASLLELSGSLSSLIQQIQDGTAFGFGGLAKVGMGIASHRDASQKKLEENQKELQQQQESQQQQQSQSKKPLKYSRKKLLQGNPLFSDDNIPITDSLLISNRTVKASTAASVIFWSR